VRSMTHCLFSAASDSSAWVADDGSRETLSDDLKVGRSFIIIQSSAQRVRPARYGSHPPPMPTLKASAPPAWRQATAIHGHDCVLPGAAEQKLAFNRVVRSRGSSSALSNRPSGAFHTFPLRQYTDREFPLTTSSWGPVCGSEHSLVLFIPRFTGNPEAIPLCLESI
jgi:hypothetical protein